ncbi:hypothetical protein [Thermomonas brevis]
MTLPGTPAMNASNRSAPYQVPVGLFGIRQVDQLGARPDRSAQRRQVVAARHRVMARQGGGRMQAGAGGLRGQRVDGEPELRRHHLVALPGEHLRELHQQFVGAVAQQQVGRTHAVLRRQRALEVAAQRVGIDVQPAQRIDDGLPRLRTGAVRIFVGAQLDQLRLGEAPAQRHQVVARIVGAQRADARLGERVEIGHAIATG